MAKNAPSLPLLEVMYDSSIIDYQERTTMIIIVMNLMMWTRQSSTAVEEDFDDLVVVGVGGQDLA